MQKIWTKTCSLRKYRPSDATKKEPDFIVCLIFFANVWAFYQTNFSIQIITINKKQIASGNVSKRGDLNDLGDHTIHLKAFGNEFIVPLKRNLNLLSPYANVVDTSIDPVTG